MLQKERALCDIEEKRRAVRDEGVSSMPETIEELVKQAIAAA